jgi:hypothetical protein
MTLGLKSMRSHRSHIPRAPVDLEDLVAEAAMEVVVMFLPCHFVTRRFSREVHGRHDPFVLQSFQIPVDSRDSQSVRVELGHLQQFLRTQWVSGLYQRSADRPALSSLSLHLLSFLPSPQDTGMRRCDL